MPPPSHIDALYPSPSSFVGGEPCGAAPSTPACTRRLHVRHDIIWWKIATGSGLSTRGYDRSFQLRRPCCILGPTAPPVSPPRNPMAPPVFSPQDPTAPPVSPLRDPTTSPVLRPRDPMAPSCVSSLRSDDTFRVSSSGPNGPSRVTFSGPMAPPVSPSRGPIAPRCLFFGIQWHLPCLPFGVREHGVYLHRIARFCRHRHRGPLPRAPSYICVGPSMARPCSHYHSRFCCQRQHRPLTGAPSHICAGPHWPIVPTFIASATFSANASAAPSLGIHYNDKPAGSSCHRGGSLKYLFRGWY